MQTSLFSKRFCAFLCLLLLASCSLLTGQLTRSKAKELVNQTPEFSTGETAQFYYGIVNYQGENTNIPAINAMRQLMNFGMLNVTVLEQVQPMGLPYLRCSVTFTDAGLKYVVSQGTDESGSYYLVRVARKEIIDITGINMLDGNSAYVNYTWHYVDLTPFANAVEMMRVQSIYSNGAVNEWPNQLFTKYDDGWRIGR